jgi:uncharacterized membrane protein YeaQ/YmgE (transglycosylase-associated protein family)
VGLISWIVVGLIAGALAGRVTGERFGCLSKIVVGLLGALIGGAIARQAGYGGIGQFGLRSIVLAALGSSLFLFVLQALGGRAGRSR